MTKRIAIYARVSTKEQNPESQIHALRQYATHRNFTIINEYIDVATGSIEKRALNKKIVDPSFRKLMDDARKRHIDCVLVWKYDRFARSLKSLLEALMEFNNLGIDFISYTQNIDTTTPSGRLFFNVIASFSEFERELIVERVKLGIDRARAKGKILGRKKNVEVEEKIIEYKKMGKGIRLISREVGISAPGVIKVLKRNGLYIKVQKQKSEIIE